MKHVKVFQLRDPVIMAIPESAREIQYHSMDTRPVRLIGDEQPYAMPMAETITCPVHCLKHAVKGNLKGQVSEDVALEYEWDPLSNTWVRAQYIAMEPELFKMLDTVIRQPYEEREQVRAARLQDAYGRIEKHKRIVNAFWALPWYKRIWLAITKDC